MRIVIDIDGPPKPAITALVVTLVSVAAGVVGVVYAVLHAVGR